MRSQAIRRVAALYDIHGNLPALEAALAGADAVYADLFVFGGDLALGPMPSEVLDRLLSLETPALYLRGNCDRLMIDAFDGRPLPALPTSVQESIGWAARQLTSRHRDFLASLPATLTVDVSSLGEVLFCHATPRSDEEIITVRTPDEQLRPILSEVRQMAVVCGHTHMQFHRRVGELHLVNAGSVGMPYGEAGAHWVLLGPHIEFKRTVYDAAAAAARIESTSYPQAAVFAARHVLQPPSEQEMLMALEMPQSLARGAGV